MRSVLRWPLFQDDRLLGIAVVLAARSRASTLTGLDDVKFGETGDAMDHMADRRGYG